MRRLILTFLVIGGAGALAPAQTRAWEKIIAPGLTYRMEADFARPLTIHGLRWSPQASAVTARAVIAGGTVFGDEGPSRGRQTVGQMAADTGAIAGMNADFFPWTGDPLGLMLSRGQLVSRPWSKRAFFAWGSGRSAFGRAEFSGQVRAGARTAALNGINEESGDNMLVYNANIAGMAPLKESGAHALLETSQEPMAGGKVSAKVVSISQEKTLKLGPGQASLSGSGTAAEFVRSLKPGDEVEVETRLTGMDFQGLTEAVAGGPWLIRDGKETVEAVFEGFGEKFSTDRHPRTAIGRTADGDIWLVVIDGRQPGMSRGVSLSETAQALIRLGCVEGINLDGGGSSELWARGVTLNKPSDPVSRPVANGIFLYPAVPLAPTQVEMVIQGRPRVTMGLFSQYRVVDSRGVEIPAGEVLWSASGSAWIDQGGFVRGVKAGEAMVRAGVRGRVLEVKVTVEDPAAAPPPTPAAL